MDTSVTKCLLLMVCEVPLLVNICSAGRISATTSCDLKNETGKKGISFIVVTENVSIPSASTQALYTTFE